MKNQVQLEPRKFLILSSSIVQDVEVAETIAPRKFGSRVHVKPDEKLQEFVGKEVFGNVDFNYATPTFLFADSSQETPNDRDNRARSRTVDKKVADPRSGALTCSPRPHL